MKFTGHLFLNYILPLAVLALAVGVFFTLGSRPDARRRTRPPQTSTPVQVVKVVPYKGDQTIQASGVAVPFRDVSVSAEVGGRIVWKNPNLQAGRFVQQGDEMLRIDPRDYEIEADRLSQMIEQNETQLQALQVDVENTDRLLVVARETHELNEKEKQRMESLVRQNAASTSEVDQARRTELSSREQSVTLENQLREYGSQKKSLQIAKKLNETQLRKAQLDLQRTTITAPIAGIVTELHVEQNATVTPGTVVATVEDTSKAEVLCHLKSDDVEFLCLDADLNKENGEDTIDIGSAYQLPQLQADIVHRRAGKQYVWKGVLSRQGGLGIDEQTRTLPCRIVVDDPRHASLTMRGQTTSKSLALVRGMFVDVKITCPAQRPMLAVPESALRPGKMLWLMRDGKLTIRPSVVTRIENAVALIDPQTTDIKVGDQAIVSPVPHARDGMVVSLGGYRAGGGKRKPQGNGTRDVERIGQDTDENARQTDVVSPTTDGIPVINRPRKKDEAA